MTDVDGVARLEPLVGSWSGVARISWPGRDAFTLTHTESVRQSGDRSMIIIEGNSYRAGSHTPVFSALAVAYDSEDGAQWHAYKSGGVLQMRPVLSPGRYAWTVPDPAGEINYSAEFDEHRWTEHGTMIIDGEPVGVFAMELTREPQS